MLKSNSTSSHAILSTETWMVAIALTGAGLALLALGIVIALGISESGVYLLCMLCLAQAAALLWLRASLTQRGSQLARQRTHLDDQLRESAAQEERNRLARDLHDTIKQQLFSINVVAATAQSLQTQDAQAAADCLNEVRSLSQAALSEMKALLTQLRPNPLDNVGLIEAIREQLEALHFRSELETELNCNDLPDSERLPIGAQESIFRAVQETLSNIARHARATHVSVTIEHDETQMKLVIADNGQGFDPSKIKVGMGLNNVRTRLTELGGKAEISSTPGQGSQVTLSLPLYKQVPQLETEMINRRYNLVYTMALFAMLSASAISYLLLNQPTWILASALALASVVGMAGIYICWGKLKPLLPTSYLPWMLATELASASGIGVGLLGLVGVLPNPSWLSTSIWLFVLLVSCTIIFIRTRLLRHTIHEWTTIERERMTIRSLQWTLPLFGLMQLVWWLEHGYIPPLSSWLLTYLAENRFWYLWLTIMLVPIIMARQNIRWLMKNYESAGLLDPNAETEPLPEPVVEVRQMRIIASVLTLLYLPVGVTVTGIRFNPQLGFNLWMGVASVVVTLLILLAKWWVERWLTARIHEWTTLADQRQAAATYYMLTKFSLMMLVGGAVGGFVGYFFGDGESAPSSVAVQIVYTILLTWLVAPSPYLGMMTYISRQRVKKLQERGMTRWHGEEVKGNTQ